MLIFSGRVLFSLILDFLKSKGVVKFGDNYLLYNFFYFVIVFGVVVVWCDIVEYFGSRKVTRVCVVIYIYVL